MQNELIRLVLPNPENHKKMFVQHSNYSLFLSSHRQVHNLFRLLHKIFDISYVRALYKRVRLSCMAQAATQYLSQVDSSNLAQYCSLDFKNITQHALKVGDEALVSRAYM